MARTKAELSPAARLADDMSATERVQRRRGAAQQDVADPARVRRGQQVQLVRQREHQVRVRHIQQFAQARGTPGLAPAGAAARAVAVAARVPAGPLDISAFCSYNKR